MRFRPCIDLHQGRVKQIVGSTLRDDPTTGPVTNFEAAQPPEYFAGRYREDGLLGGHVIMLGPGNRGAALAALQAYPNGLQLGGGMTPENAPEWLALGAGKIIVTSYVFPNAALSWDRLHAMAAEVGRENLVLDLSCRAINGRYVVAMNRWQTLTDLELNREALARLAETCCEFLIHGVDVEGKRGGVDTELVSLLAEWVTIPTTYAGGIRSLADMELIESIGKGRLDATVGSALDIFGGELPYTDVVAFDRERR